MVRLRRSKKTGGDASFSEKRRYTRLDQIFPVEFLFLDEKGQPVSDWRQGFTQDIGNGGLCLIVNQLQPEDIRRIVDRKTSLQLNIHIPLRAEGVRAVARFAWFDKLKDEPVRQYAIGLSYDKIGHKDNQRILRYAAASRFFRGVAVTFAIFLGAGLVLAGFHTAKLRYENEELLSNLSSQLEHQRILTEGRDLLRLQVDEMKFLLSQSERKIGVLEEELAAAKSDDHKAISDLEGSISRLKNYQQALKGELSELLEKKAKADVDVHLRAQETDLLEKKISDKFYLWLVLHQNNRTGLITSFEGDKNLRDWAFSYDQALAAIVFTEAGDLEKAGRILDFYIKAERIDDGGFANAYYASTGQAAEYVAHAGPNIWLGLAILQYTYKSKDTRYLELALDIGRWLETLKDSDGGLRGGKRLSWYSTEHNLDAYAFYNISAQLIGETHYKDMAKASLDWLGKNAYSAIMNPLVKRGKGDSTIATDTFAWSITAVGPEKLKEIGMDADSIIDFAISNCSVKVDYKRPHGPQLTVEGFDFAKYKHLARGGVVSCEWTAQMVLALKIMADYHQGQGNLEVAGYYADLGYFYISELSKMIITSPSPVGQGGFCLPYASHEFVDTGHGWRTPQGERTGSVAATAYAIFAIKDYNPLSLNEQS